MKKVLY